MIFFGIGLFLSFTGYFYVIYRHLHFSWYTIPIFISSMISIGTYVGGLANLLLPVSYCIYHWNNYLFPTDYKPTSSAL